MCVAGKRKTLGKRQVFDGRNTREDVVDIKGTVKLCFSSLNEHSYLVFCFSLFFFPVLISSFSLPLFFFSLLPLFFFPLLLSFFRQTETVLLQVLEKQMPSDWTRLFFLCVCVCVCCVLCVVCCVLCVVCCVLCVFNEINTDKS